MDRLPSQITYEGTLFLPHFPTTATIELFNRKGVLTGTMRTRLGDEVQVDLLRGSYAGGRCEFTVRNERYGGACDARSFNGAMLNAPEGTVVSFELEAAVRRERQ